MNMKRVWHFSSISHPVDVFDTEDIRIIALLRTIFHRSNGDSVLL